MNREALKQIQKQLEFIPTVDSSIKPYATLKQVGQLVYLSGSVAFSNGQLLYAGRIGSTVSEEDGKKSAMLCVINLLSAFDREYGLERLDHVVKVNGYLSCAETFGNHPSIMNAGSQILLDIFGEKGTHARTSLGVHTLPLGASVEVEMIVSLSN